MANHVKHTVTVTGPAEDVANFLERCFSTREDGSPSFDFASIIPIPKALDATQYTDWNDWGVQNWGTKWDSEETSFAPGQPIPGATQLTFFFETAWDPPLPVFVEMSRQFPALRFHVLCSGEMCCFLGTGEFSSGRGTFQRRWYDESHEIFQQIVSGERDETSSSASSV